MNLDILFVQTFSTTQQLTIARELARFHSLTAKPNKTASEASELVRVTDFLRPYTDEGRKPTTPAASSQDQRNKAPVANRGVILNARKIEAARLSGARELALHRDSAALGRLLAKPQASLSVGELHELKTLKQRLGPYVGMEGSPATDSDFRVAA